jgi:hypothetical protein
MLAVDPDLHEGFAPAGPPPYWQAQQDTKDEEHLRLLGIFYYVMAGITALFSLIPLIHVSIGLAMVLDAFPSSSGPPPPSWFGWFFVAIGSSIILVGEVLAVLTFLAGRGIAERRSRTLALVVAGVHCLNMPLGTLFGVFAFITLLRDSVAKRFDRR